MTTTTNPADPSAKEHIHPQAGSDVSGESSFEKLLNRQMSEEERVHLRAVRDTLGLKPNDAMWLIFFALDYYRSLYSQFPPMIRAAAEAVLIEYKEQTDATMESSAQRLKDTADQLRGLLVEATHKATQDAQVQLSATITKSAKQVARRARLGQFWPWLLSGTVIMALAVLLVTGIGVGFDRYYEGYAKGYIEGWQDAEVKAQKN